MIDYDHSLFAYIFLQVKDKVPKPKKKVTVQKNLSSADYVDEENEELMQVNFEKSSNFSISSCLDGGNKLLHLYTGHRSLIKRFCRRCNP